MKRTRNKLPSWESQKPLTFHCLPLFASSKTASTDTSVNGLPASGDATRKITSTKSNVSTEGFERLKETFAGAAKTSTGRIRIANAKSRVYVRRDRIIR